MMATTPTEIKVTLGKEQIDDVVQRATRMAELYDQKIKNQRDSITRLLDNPDAAAEIAQLNELLAKAQARIQELEEYIGASSSSELEVVTKQAAPLDPAESGEGETGHDSDWKPPVDLYRPVKSLPPL